MILRSYATAVPVQLVAPPNVTTSEAGSPAILALDCASAGSAPFGCTTLEAPSDCPTSYSWRESPQFLPVCGCPQFLHCRKDYACMRDPEKVIQPAPPPLHIYIPFSRTGEPPPNSGCPGFRLFSDLRLVYHRKVTGHNQRAGGTAVTNNGWRRNATVL